MNQDVYLIGLTEIFPSGAVMAFSYIEGFIDQQSQRSMEREKLSKAILNEMAITERHEG
jgi:hypothetical protein